MSVTTAVVGRFPMLVEVVAEVEEEDDEGLLAESIAVPNNSLRAALVGGEG